MSKYAVGDKVLVEGEIGDYLGGHYRVHIGNQCVIYAREDTMKDDSKTYSDGLTDAWELARKICGEANSKNNNLTGKQLGEIFGYSHSAVIMDNNTYKQALAKIEAYEKSQQIQIGDIVRRISDDKEYLIITEEEDDSAYKYGVIVLKSMTIDRITGDLLKFEKTGRHIDISSILEQIRGDK